MKIVVVQFPDAADVAAAVNGASATVNIGATTISDGVIVTSFKLEDPAPPTPVLVPHTHPVAGVTGPAA